MSLSQVLNLINKMILETHREIEYCDPKTDIRLAYLHGFASACNTIKELVERAI
jgi:hypothetical protein